MKEKTAKVQKSEEMLQALRTAERLYWGKYDSAGMCTYDVSADLYVRLDPIWRHSLEVSPDSDRLTVISVYTNVYMWSFSKGGDRYVFGPICSVQVTVEQARAFAHQWHLKDSDVVRSHHSMQQLNALSSLTRMIVADEYENKAGETSDQKDIYFQAESLMEDKADYDIYRITEDAVRSPYAEERVWFEAIKEGRDISIDTDGAETVGMLAKGSDLKQLEYTIVSGITLATRAAIEGGVPEFVARDTSDLLLQQLSQMKTAGEMSDPPDFTGIFTELVRRFKKTTETNYIADQAKDYIAAHLYRKFSIQQMADDLSVDRSYLSRTFSESQGETISGYIRGERLKAAANLLKFSEEPVSAISEYMQFSTPGKFCGYFWEKYGVTPAQYRRKNKIPQFMSSEK